MVWHKVAWAMLYRIPHLTHFHFAMQIICQFLPYWGQRLQRGSRRDWTARVNVLEWVSSRKVALQRPHLAVAAPGGVNVQHPFPIACRCVGIKIGICQVNH